MLWFERQFLDQSTSGAEDVASGQFKVLKYGDLGRLADRCVSSRTRPQDQFQQQILRSRAGLYANVTHVTVANASRAFGR